MTGVRGATARMRLAAGTHGARPLKRAAELWRSAGRDLTAENMASSVALGVMFGVFPAPTLPTLLCALAAIVLRVNPGPIQAVNYLASPLQLALFVPLGRLGRWLFPALFRVAAPPPGDAAAVSAWSAAGSALSYSGHAIAAWFCVCAPAGLLLYFTLTSLARRRSSPPEGAAACLVGSE